MKKYFKHLLMITIFITSAALSFWYFKKDDSKVIGIWNIENGQLIENNKNMDNMLARQYWDVFYSLFPKHIINQYVVYFSLMTDGLDGDLGSVFQKDKELKKWGIDIDIADMDLTNIDEAYVDDYIHTFIHEFGHIISLNHDQVNPIENKNYKGYVNDEGYARKNSYIDLFFNEFWKDQIWKEWDTAYNHDTTEDRSLAIEALYHNNINSFITEYASENPEEDFAESFVFFVMNDKPKGEVIKEEKILFFYQFPELIEYRLYIREQISTYKQGLRP